MSVDKIEQMPIYRAMQIVKLIEDLAHIFPEDDVFLQFSKEFMIADSFTIPAKIAGE